MDYSRYFWQGERVRLRPVRVDDAEKVVEDRLDSPARQLLELGVDLPTTLEAIREKLHKFEDCREIDGVILFTVENLEGESVGFLSMHSMDRKNGTFSFGVGVSRPHRRKGYAEDAIRILLRYAFREQRYHKCNSACIASNEASAWLHRKLGFVEEGRRREVAFYDDCYHDELWFGMTREEFDALQGQPPC